MGIFTFLSNLSFYTIIDNLGVSLFCGAITLLTLGGGIGCNYNMIRHDHDYSLNSILYATFSLINVLLNHLVKSGYNKM